MKKISKRIMAIMLSLAMIMSCIPYEKVNASAGTYIPFIYYEMQDVNTGDHLRDIVVDAMSLIMYDTSIGYNAREKIDIDLSDCTFTYLLKPDTDFVPAEADENPEIEPETTYGLQIVSYIPKSELDKYSITASELQDAQYSSNCRINHGKEHDFGYTANNFTAIEEGDNIKLTSIVEYFTYDKKRLHMLLLLIEIK